MRCFFMGASGAGGRVFSVADAWSCVDVGVKVVTSPCRHKAEVSPQFAAVGGARLGSGDGPYGMQLPSVVAAPDAVPIRKAIAAVVPGDVSKVPMPRWREDADNAAARASS